MIPAVHPREDSLPTEHVCFSQIHCRSPGLHSGLGVHHFDVKPRGHFFGTDLYDRMNLNSHAFFSGEHIQRGLNRDLSYHPSI